MKNTRNAKGQFVPRATGTVVKKEITQKKRDYGYLRARRERDAALAILGGLCVKCGFSDKRALQIDHINGDGINDRRKTFGRYHVRVVESVIAKENKYQLLCANCNWIKRFENKEFKTR